MPRRPVCTDASPRRRNRHERERPPGCDSACLGIGFGIIPEQPNTTVTVTYALDGSGETKSVTAPVPGGNIYFCAFAMGFPEPPYRNCLVVIDPDN